MHGEPPDLEFDVALVPHNRNIVRERWFQMVCRTCSYASRT